MKNTLTFLFFFLFFLNLSAQKLKYKFEQVSPVSGISFNGVTCIQEDKNGFIWLGGSNGIFFYDGTQFKNYSKAHGSCNRMLSGYIFDIFNDNENTLWVCTSSGLIYFDVNKDQFYPVDLF